MRDLERELQDRPMFPNLDPAVELQYCTKSFPMDIDGKNAELLKQLWFHDDAEETVDSKELDGSYMTFSCPNCQYTYTVFVGD